MSFGVEDKMIFEAEKKRRKRAGEMGSSYVLSYVLKSAVELELFSNLWYFKNYFFQLLYIYQESHILVIAFRNKDFLQQYNGFKK